MELNLIGYAPKQYHKQIRWRMKKMMGLTSFEDALKELISFTQWLSTFSHEARSSMEEVGEELLTVHKLKLTRELRISLSSTNMIESLIQDQILLLFWITHEIFFSFPVATFFILVQYYQY